MELAKGSLVEAMKGATKWVENNNHWNKRINDKDIDGRAGMVIGDPIPIGNKEFCYLVDFSEEVGSIVVNSKFLKFLF